MPLITPAYFTGPLQLPGKDLTDLAASLTQPIARYEPEFLRKVLGIEFADAVTAAPDAYPLLINGATFTHTDKAYYWPGLANATTLTSPIANYVYWMYKRDTATHADNTGENISEVENARVVAPIQKQVTAWNDMVDMLVTMRLYLDTDVYDEWDKYATDSFDLLRKQNIFNL